MFTAVLGVDKDDKGVLILHRVEGRFKMAACLKKAFRVWVLERNMDHGMMDFC